MSILHHFLENVSADTIKFFHSVVPISSILSVLKFSIPSAFAMASFSVQSVIALFVLPSVSDEK